LPLRVAHRVRKRRAMPKRAPAKKPAPAWQDVAEPQTDTFVLKAVREVEDFWTHGSIDASQITNARVRSRGSRKTKTNTDLEINIAVDAVVYKAAIRGEGDPSIRCPVDGRVWVTQPCVVCGKDDGEEFLLLCGTDEPNAAVPGCNRSHHTYCVGLDEVPEEDWFCPSCQVMRNAVVCTDRSAEPMPSQEDPDQYLFPRHDEDSEILGYVLYEDGKSFVFYTETQYNLYLGDSTMRGPLWDNGQNYVGWGCPGDPEAVRARELHERNHGTAVFLFPQDFDPGMSFPTAKRLAEDRATLPATARRTIGGLATTTARVSTGGPAPRPPISFINPAPCV